MFQIFPFIFCIYFLIPDTTNCVVYGIKEIGIIRPFEHICMFPIKRQRARIVQDSVYGRYGEQLIAQADFAPPSQITVLIGAKWGAAAISQREPARGLAFRQAVDHRVFDRVADVDRLAVDPYLGTSHAEGRRIDGDFALLEKPSHSNSI